VIEVPLTADFPHYAQETDLAEAVYEPLLRWNARSGTWYMTISRDGEVLLAGRRVLTDANLLGRFKDGRLPGGVLVTVDADASRAEPGRDDLGGRSVLIHLTREEVEAAGGL